MKLLNWLRQVTSGIGQRQGKKEVSRSVCPQVAVQISPSRAKFLQDELIEEVFIQPLFQEHGYRQRKRN